MSVPKEMRPHSTGMATFKISMLKIASSTLMRLRFRRDMSAKPLV